MNTPSLKQYFIQQTKEGVFIILIAARHTAQDNSFLQYDGKEHALFLRTASETILFDHINPIVRQKLLDSPYVQIAEVDTHTKQIARYYRAPVHKVPFVVVV